MTLFLRHQWYSLSFVSGLQLSVGKFLLCLLSRLSFVSVVFDFNASLIDVVPVSSMLFPVDLMQKNTKEKSGLLIYHIVRCCFFCTHFPDRVEWGFCLLSMLHSMMLHQRLQSRLLKKKKGWVVYGLSFVLPFFVFTFQTECSECCVYLQCFTYWCCFSVSNLSRCWNEYYLSIVYDFVCFNRLPTRQIYLSQWNNVHRKSNNFRVPPLTLMTCKFNKWELQNDGVRR